MRSLVAAMSEYLFSLRSIIFIKYNYRVFISLFILNFDFDFCTKIFHFVCRLSSLYIRTVPRGVRRGVRGVRGVPSVEPALEPPPDMKSLLSGDASHLAAALRVANRFL